MKEIQKHLMITIGLFFAIVFLISGCGTDPLEKAVMEYNAKLPAALKNGSAVLHDVATEREQGRMEIYLSQLKDQNQILDTHLLELKVKSKSVKELVGQEVYNNKVIYVLRPGEKPNPLVTYYDSVKGLVETQEVWLIKYLNAKTGKQIGVDQKVTYDTIYTLARKNNKWYVADIDFIDEQIKP